MNKIFIEKIEYKAKDYHFVSPIFTNGINIITGKNGRGKTTFMNFIYYLLGGSVDGFNENSKEKQSIIVDDCDGYVKGNISINGEFYIFQRSILGKNKNIINIIDKDGLSKSLQIDRTENIETFSDWMLNKLNITPFTVSSGINSWIFNFKDLLRLIYHDQLSDRTIVYKTPDGKPNFINDSTLIRKIIFEVINNNSSIEYYSKINELREIDMLLRSQKKTLEILETSIARHLGIQELRNIDTIKSEIAKIDLGILITDSELKKITNNTQSFNDSSKQVEKAFMKLRELYNKRVYVQKDFDLAIQELNSFYSLYRIQKNEIKNIENIIFTQNNLSIIDPTVCPICGKKVDDRKENHCICGGYIEESKFSAFFYTQKDHQDILYSKVKSLTTTERAISHLETTVNVFQCQIDDIKKEISNLKKIIESENQVNSQERDNNSIKQILDEIKGLNSKKSILEKELIYSIEYSSELKKRYEMDENYKRLKIEHDLLELRLRNEMLKTVNLFSKKYSDFLKKFDNTIHEAKIDDDYEPIFNNNSYINAATRSPRRFYYYLTLLVLSLENNTPFPRFLMIDTPQNFGLDADNTTKLIESLGTLNEHYSDNEFQIFLTINNDFVSEKMIKYKKYDIKDKILVKNQILSE